MNEGSVRLLLDGNRRVYQPGEALAGEYRLDSLKTVEPAAVELSVLWHTEGQGDEDLAVHYFERLSAGEQPGVDLRRPRRFSTRLPLSPLSYQGEIVQIRWCVRVRFFLARGKELFAEAPFQLGLLPTRRTPKPVIDADARDRQRSL